MSTERRLQVTKRFTLEMAHALTGHDGPCKHLHGHSYVLDITLLGEPMDRPDDPKNGMVMDFADLKAIVKHRVVDHYDHALVLHETERRAVDMDHPLFARTYFTPWQPTCEYLLLDMDQGLLLVHLGMSGSLSFMIHPPEPGKHDHFELHTTQGVLRLNDPRRFGAVVYAPDESHAMAQKLLGKLGMEPLGENFDAKLFHHGLLKRKAPIKQVLLAGEVVVGVGNIYASEVLFLAGIRPGTPAARLTRPRAARLHQAIRDVLARAVERGGSTLRDFSNAQGEAGHFQLDAMVYAREGLDCKVCGTPIKGIRQGQRSTFFCAQCQKP